MPRAPFQLIAEVPGRPASELSAIGEHLGRTFGAEFTDDELRRGVCLMRHDDLKQVKAWVESVLVAGADFRVVDDDGATVAQGRARTAGAAPMNVPSRTILGVPPPRVAGPPPPPAPPAPSRPSGGGFDLDSLDESSLVTLDGESGVSESWGGTFNPSAPQPATPAPGPMRGVDDRAFLPPESASIETPLEIDRPTPPPAPPPPVVEAPLEIDRREPESWDDAPAVVAQGAGDDDDFAPVPVDPSASATGPKPRMTAARRAASAAPRFQLLGGRLRQWPRLRVLGGFLLALGLGSILPMCHASSVLETRVAPLRQKLSHAKAYGHLLSGSRGFRGADQWQATIDAITRRHRIYSFLIWLVIGGGIGAAWFRFT